jgi:hypothetical protein
MTGTSAGYDNNRLAVVFSLLGGGRHGGQLQGEVASVTRQHPTRVTCQKKRWSREAACHNLMNVVLLVNRVSVVFLGNTPSSRVIRATHTPQEATPPRTPRWFILVLTFG